MQTTWFWLPLALLIAVVIVSWAAIGPTKRSVIQFWLSDLAQTDDSLGLALGTSSIYRLDFDEYLDCRQWLNRGLENATVSDLLMYLRWTPIRSEPPIVLVYAGENSIANERSVSDTAKDMHELLQILAKRFPQAETHVIAIKPSPARFAFWSDFRELNGTLLEVITKMKRSGAALYFHQPDWGPSDEASHQAFVSDGVHLTHDGYRIFTSGVSNECQRLQGE